MMRLPFAGHDFELLREGALLWRARGALIVADLHFEKASWYARGGQMLPPYDSVATLCVLEALVARHGVREVWALGDSFHDAAGPQRLPTEAEARLRNLVGCVDWTWITGNHDAASAGALGGAVVTQTEIEGVMLRHQAEPDDGRPELSGHYHPKWRVSGRGRSVSRRCFVHGGNRMILPAFGALAGGLDAGAAPIRRLTGPLACAIVPVARGLLRFPIGP